MLGIESCRRGFGPGSVILWGIAVKPGRRNRVQLASSCQRRSHIDHQLVMAVYGVGHGSMPRNAECSKLARGVGEGRAQHGGGGRHDACSCSTCEPFCLAFVPPARWDCSTPDHGKLALLSHPQGQKKHCRGFGWLAIVLFAALTWLSCLQRQACSSPAVDNIGLPRDSFNSISANASLTRPASFFVAMMRTSSARCP